MNNPFLKTLSIATLAAAVAACGGSGSGSSDSDSSTGTASLSLTDAPVTDLSAAQLNITSVELKPANSDSVTIELDTAMDINLLDFQGGKVAELFEGEELPAGEYEWIRLHLGEDPYVVEASDPNQTPIFLFLPSGRQTGLKLQGGFVIPAGGTAEFTIDFDVKKSIINAGGNAPSGSDKYILKPAHRLVDNSESGAIVGEVDVVNIEQQLGCDVDDDYYGSVYVYEGADVEPTDLNVNEEGGPLVAVTVSNEDQASLYSYKAAFLPAGDYTISYTCQPDDNEASETLEFVGTQNVTVTANTETTADVIQ
ncbi:DUF4382 domain-containing protein [Marinobacter sp. OP 3.4]|uniref:DUF4382 domain-containing protein n=1 Tax=Marinobacter sp. OP 3.4 TaxID=3076501 RepID=UPI002E1CC9AE